MTTDETPVTDLTQVREEIDAIRREALTYGFSLDAERGLAEMRRTIAAIREERAGKPPCYRRAYLATAPQCRVCDEAEGCAAPAEVPAYLPVEDLAPVQCETCGEGMLSRELLDEATGVVRNYGCDQDGCPGTLVEQSRWQPPPKKPVKVPKAKQITERIEHDHYYEIIDQNGNIVDRRPKKGLRMSNDEVDAAILEVVRDAHLIDSKQGILRMVPASRPRVQKRIDRLVFAKRLKYRKSNGYSMPSD